MRVTSLVAAAVLAVSGSGAALGQGTPAGGSGAAAAPAAKPQGWAYVEKANAAVAITPGTEDIAPVLFPALAAMKPAPAGCDTVDSAMLLAKGGKGWDAAAGWAQGAEQQAVLKALTTITDTKKKYLLGIPYGTQGLDPAWVKAGLCVDLPASGLLQGARYRYRAGLDRLVMLVNVEATRLANEGKPDEALTKCVQWLRLARIIAEREGVRERRWGMNNLMLASERMRDIAYTFRDKLTSEMTRNAADDLDERLIGVRRIRLPLLEKLAAEQLVERVIIEKGEVDAPKFASTMARLSADQRALNLFGEAAWYRELAASHAGWFDTRDQLNKVFGGWANRWNVENLHDDLLQIPSDYLKMDKARFALLELTANEIEGLERLRLEVLTQLAGTRVALGVVGYERKEKRWPPNVNAIAPAYVRVLDTDPFGYDKRFKNLNAFYFKVPIRDDVKKEREEPKNHEMTVGVGEAGAPSSPSAPAVPPAIDPELTAMVEPVLTLLRMGAMVGAPDHSIGDSDLANVDSMLAFMGEEVRLLHKSVRKAQSYDAAAEMLNKTFKGQSTTAEQIAEGGYAKVAQMSMPDDVQKKLGINFNAMRDAIVEGGKARETTAKMKEMFEAAKAGTLTPALVEAGEIEGIDALVKSPSFRVVSEEVRKLYTGPMGSKIREFEAKVAEALKEAKRAAGGSISVTVTPKDFLLWSVGPDSSDDQARDVGVGGSDVLLWPPILSLRREHEAK